MKPDPEPRPRRRAARWATWISILAVLAISGFLVARMAMYGLGGVKRAPNSSSAPAVTGDTLPASRAEAVFVLDPGSNPVTALRHERAGPELASATGAPR